MVTVWWYEPVWFAAAFWIPVKPLHLRSMLSKSLRCTENCNACSWHWSTEWAQFFPTETPDCRSYNQCLKNWTNWATKFCLICHYSSDLSPTNYHFFKHLNNFFLQGKHFQQVAGNAFQEFTESWSMDFYATELNLFLTGKNVLIIMVPILISKDVFAPSCNDLKFMAWNHNYFCTNPILSDMYSKHDLLIPFCPGVKELWPY